KDLPAKVEGYKKTDPPAKIAARFAALVADSPSRREAAGGWVPRAPHRPVFVGSPSAISFPLKGGRVWLHPAHWTHNAAAIISRSNGLLKDDNGRAVLTLKPDEFATKDSDMIACEVECRRDGVDGPFVELEIPGLDALISGGAR